jgi:hypothetical protein
VGQTDIKIIKDSADYTAAIVTGSQENVMASPKLRATVTIDTDSADVDRVMIAISRAESNPDMVALTQNVAVRSENKYRPATVVLPRPDPVVGAEETAFLAAALSGAPSPKQARDKLRLLYVHRSEGRDVFVSDDADTFDAPGSERRQRLNRLASPARIMSSEGFVQSCQLRRQTGRWD